MQEPELSLLTIDALCFAAGASLCALMGFLQWRSPQTSGGAPGLIVLWICGGIWSSVSFATTMAQLLGAGPESEVVRSLAALAWTSSAIGPLIAFRSVDEALERRLPARRLVLSLAGLASLGVAVMIVFASLESSDGFDLIEAAIISFFVSLASLVVAGALYVLRRGPRRPARPKARSPLGRVVLGFWLVWIALTLFNILTPPSGSVFDLITGRLNQHWTIPVSILAALSVARTYYADVVLKRSLLILLSIFVPAAIAWQTPGLPHGAPLLMASLPVSLVILTGPLIYRGMNFLIDRVLLKRPDYAAAAAAYADDLSRARDLKALDRITESHISATLGLEARLAAAAEGEGAVTIAFEADRPLALSPAGKAAALLHAEHRFLDAVAREYGRRRDALAFENERREQEIREATLKAAVAEAELKALRAQVDPHFLFNTLNAITSLIAVDPDRAEAMTERLAAFFRYTLDRQERTTTTVDEELDFVRQYLEIEKVRFGDRLTVDIRKDQDLGSESAPPLILQPLVENAIRHGLASKLDGGRIDVEARREGDRIRLSVTDDGVGFSAKSKPRVGLSNVRERLRALYGDAAEMTVGKGPGGKGASIVLMLPA